ncbi:MAG: tryptophan--tRNA ligase, partial [Clostridia bacterium]
NYLAMTASTDVINTKVRSMVTDPGRIQKTDPGNPDICAVYAYHKIFNEPNAVDVEQNCKAGTIGCVDCKKRLANVLHDLIGPMHDRKEELLKRPDYVRHILDEGAVKMRKMAQQTIEQVREIMGLKWV